MLGVIKSDVITDLSRIHVPTPEELAEMEAQQQAQAEAMRLQLSHQEFDGLLAEEDEITTEQNAQANPVTSL